MSSQSRVFAAAALGSAVLAALASLGLLATELNLLGYLGPFTVGLVLAGVVSAWIVAPRMGAAAGWAAATVAAITYTTILVSLFAIGMSNHPPS
jgi:hypothetical protein